MARGLKEAARKERLKACAHAALDGLSMTKTAARLEITLPTLSIFLNRHDKKLAAALKENGAHGMALTPLYVKDRLEQVVKFGHTAKGITDAAAEMGMSYPALDRWLRLYAPDGAAAALADFTDDE